MCQPSKAAASLFGWLSAIAILRWHSQLLSTGLRVDETVYMEAFRLVAEGRSPYDQSGYFYTPIFAGLGALLLGRLGEASLAVLFHAANLLGVVAIVWASLLRTGWRFRWMAITGALLVAWAPPVEHALWFGNLSPIVAGLALLGLHVADHHPLSAGLLVSASVLVKPIALPVVPLLLADRSRRHRRAGLAAALSIGAALVFVLEPMREMLLRVEGRPYALANASLERLLSCFGLVLPPLVLLAAATLAGLLAVRRLKPHGTAFTALACAVCLLGFPVVWPHTLLLALPAQCATLAYAVGELRAARSDAHRRSALLALLMVGAAWLAIFSSEFYSPEIDLPARGVGLLLLPPVLATPGLAALLLWRRRPPHEPSRL